MTKINFNKDADVKYRFPDLKTGDYFMYIDDNTIFMKTENEKEYVFLTGPTPGKVSNACLDHKVLPIQEITLSIKS